MELPLSFEANDEKILRWEFLFNTSVEQHWDLVTEEKCMGDVQDCASICEHLKKNNDSVSAATTFYGRIAVQGSSEVSTTSSKKRGTGCETVPKYEFTVLSMDTRGNVFDEAGALKSLDVMYAWWTLSNNRTIPERFVGIIKMYYQILSWKISAFVPIPK